MPAPQNPVRAKYRSVACPECKAQPGKRCVTASGNILSSNEHSARVKLTKKNGSRRPDKFDREDIDRFIANTTCTTCLSGPGVMCVDAQGRNYYNFIHSARANAYKEYMADQELDDMIEETRRLTADPLVLDQVSDPDDAPDTKIILTEQMAKDLAAHLRGETVLEPDVVETLADLLHHKPTILERVAMGLFPEDAGDFFKAPLFVREEYLEIAKKAVQSYYDGLEDLATERKIDSASEEFVELFLEVGVSLL